MEACYTGHTPTLKVYVRNQTSSYAQQNTGLFEMIVGVLTKCHTQYT